MRRVNIVTGIKQRMHDILGTNLDISSGEITAWSIQSAMLSNFKRICLSLLNGSTTGKVLSGLNASYTSSLITIEGGYGVTVNGDIVTLPGPINIPISYTGMTTGSNNFICLKYSLVPMATGGKETSICGQSGMHQIVFDESGAADNYANIVVIKSTIDQVLADHDCVYIGTATIAGGIFTTISPVMLSIFGQSIVKLDDEMAIPKDVPMIVKFPDILNNTAQEYDASTGLYTASSSAYRQVSWVLATQANPSWGTDEKYLKTYLSINDIDDANYCFQGRYCRSNNHDYNEIVSQGNCLIYLNGGDTVSLKVFHNCGSTLYIPPRVYPGYTLFEKNMCYMTISTIQDR